MKSLFGRHKVRSSFYHITSAIVAVSTLAQLTDLMPTATCFYITSVLFFADYLAHMYDPHPEKMGPWFKSHFHRFIDDEE